MPITRCMCLLCGNVTHQNGRIPPCSARDERKDDSRRLRYAGPACGGRRCRTRCRRSQNQGLSIVHARKLVDVLVGQRQLTMAWTQSIVSRGRLVAVSCAVRFLLELLQRMMAARVSSKNNMATGSHVDEMRSIAPRQQSCSAHFLKHGQPPDFHII